MSFKDTLQGLNRTIQSLQAQRDALIEDTQKRCSHPVEHILEVGYRDNQYFTADPPFRVCKLCGYAEEGWYCGYWKLETREEIPRISRERAHSEYVLRFYTQEKLTKIRYNK